MTRTGGYPIFSRRSSRGGGPSGSRFASCAAVLWILALAPGPAGPPGSAALLAAGAAPEEKPVRLVYKYAKGQVLHQTTRQVQKFSSEAEPSLSGETVSVGRTETRVIDVDPNGTALLDEVITYEADPAKKDHRRSRTTRQGEIRKLEVIEGDPSTLQEGALFPDRAVRPGDTWQTRLKGISGGPAYFIKLDVTFKEKQKGGAGARAVLDLKGSVDSQTLTAMLGPAAIRQGIVSNECQVTGGVIFAIDAGKEDSSRIAFDCSLEVTVGGKIPSPARLQLTYETQMDTSIPSIPAP